VWDVAALDALTETVVRRILIEGDSARRIAIEMAADLALQAPHLPALALTLPFTLAAAAIDEMLGSGLQARAAAQDAWRVAALIGADALALRMEGADGIADLVARWRLGDEMFGP